MKSNLYLFVMGASILGTNNLYAGIPGMCPEITEAWKKSSQEAIEARKKGGECIASIA